MRYYFFMDDKTIVSSSAVGKRLDSIIKREKAFYLSFKGTKIPIVSVISIGRAPENSVVIDNKLASRHHAVIQKIKNEYFLKDLQSTNGTYLNGERIPVGKYVKLSRNDTISIGKTNLILG